MDNKKLTIRVNINERFYPLNIESKDEEKIRKAANNINEMIAKYREMFKNKDGQDFLAMVALQLGTKVQEFSNNNELEQVIADIKDVNYNLEAFLKE
jgi:cell division protein ZapA